MTEHDEQYYERNRNGFDYITAATDPRIPHYYVGRHYKYEARKIVEDYELSYNLGTACSYILRSARKHSDYGVSDIKKAIAHLEFELEKIKNKS